MNNSTGDFTTSEASTNSTIQTIGLLESLEMCLYLINFLFGLPTHFFIIWRIVTETESGVASEFFILNLSICEIGNCLNCFICLLSRFGQLPQLSYVSSAFFNLRKVAYVLQSLGITGRPLFQCLMCVERYLAVVHPVTFLKFKPLRYRVICCSVVWMIILGCCLLCLLLSIYTSYHIYTWFFSLQLLLFFFIQLFCCVAVLRALKQSEPGERGRERKEENHMKRRAFKIIKIITVSMVVTYAPFTLFGLVTALKQEFKILWLTALVCYVVPGFVHPGLYVHRAGKLFCHCTS